MKNTFTLQYWLDDNWYVGKILEIPGVFSQGETLEELISNVKEVYDLLIEENLEIPELKNNVVSEVAILL
jgi:predicted RNase H-like HicB family nuclease